MLFSKNHIPPASLPMTQNIALFAIEQLPLPTWAIHKQTGNVFLNHKALHICNGSIGTHPLALIICNPDQDALQAQFQAIYHLGSSHARYEIKTKQRKKWAREFCWEYKVSDNETYLCGCISPIGQNDMEFEILEMVYDYHPDPTFIFNSNYDIEFINRQACNLLGKPKEYFLGNSILNIEHANQTLGDHISPPNWYKLSHFNFRMESSYGCVLDVDASLSFVNHNDAHYGVLSLRNTEHQTNLQATNALMARVLHESMDGMVIIDRHGIIIKTNPALSEILEYSPNILLNRHVKQLSDADPRNNNVLLNVWNSYKRNGSFEGEVELVNKHGKSVMTWLKFFSIRRFSGENDYVCLISNINPIRQKIENLDQLAHHDPLTGLPNRLLFKARLEHVIQRSKRENQCFALLFLDLDLFKMINDQFGHEAGDAVLQEFAKRVCSCIRAVDTLARLGGDEFVLILETLSHPRDSKIVIDKIFEALAETFVFNGQKVPIRCSVGISTYPQDGKDSEELLKRADDAMYQAKKTPGTSAHFYSPIQPWKSLDF